MLENKVHEEKASKLLQQLKNADSLQESAPQRYV